MLGSPGGCDFKFVVVLPCLVWGWLQFQLYYLWTFWLTLTFYSLWFFTLFFTGTFIAILTVVVLTIRWAVEEFAGPDKTQWETGVHLKHLVDFFIIGVTVLVVAVPEGLPLAVTLSLAYSVRVSVTRYQFIIWYLRREQTALKSDMIFE